MNKKRFYATLSISMPLAVFSTSVLVAEENFNADQFRSFDGTSNNLENPLYGSTDIDLTRLSENSYSDGVSSLAGADRPNPREISNAVMAQSESVPNNKNVSDFIWQWGQFLDHDISLTQKGDIAADIPVPLGDPSFDPFGQDDVVIPFNRSGAINEDTGTDVDNPLQQINSLTAWIDASNVYGSDEERARALRAGDGSGRLATSEGDLLPFNGIDTLNGEILKNDNGPGPNPEDRVTQFFAAGDIRANEQVGLIAMHTLFLREHNRKVDHLNRNGIRGDKAYFLARQHVGALMQAITYNEFLPALLGKKAIPRYRGYNPALDPAISNEFSTASFRLGHSMLNEQILRVDKKGDTIAEGDLPLIEAFFNPSRITEEGGIEPILRGLANQEAQQVDTLMTDAIRNFLFGPPGAGGLDLASMNIQRGRDHGIATYNDVRIAFGLEPAFDFSDITSDEETIDKLSSVYDSVDQVDLWVGSIAEDKVKGALAGELLIAVLADQFERLRDGDRFWYENILSKKQINEIKRTKLSTVIERNTNIKKREIQRNVFKVSQKGVRGVNPTKLSKITERNINAKQKGFFKFKGGKKW